MDRKEYFTMMITIYKHTHKKRIKQYMNTLLVNNL